MKRIVLKDLFGEFCTDRHLPEIQMLKRTIENEIKADSPVTLDRSGVKLLSVSFIDELLGDLAVQHSREKIKDLVLFNPPLENIYEEQIDRSVRLRK